MNRWKPTFVVPHYSHITPEWLKAHQIKFILSDLDGTLAPEDEPADETFSNWLEAIQQAGVGLIIVSNNTPERVASFVQVHHLVGQGECHKPSTRVMEEQFFQKGLHSDTTLFMGDQLFTDIWCANRLGLQSVLVGWIPGKEVPTLKLKRFFERLLLKRWNLT